MKTLVRNLCVVFVALGTIWLCGASSQALGEQVNHEFNFNDGTVPDVLEVWSFNCGDAPTETLTYDASSGQLHIYDTVAAACGVTFKTEEVFTDSHISAVFSPNGGDPGGYAMLTARDSGTPDAMDDVYGCGLRSYSDGGVRMGLDKWVDGQMVWSQATPSIVYYNPGPYVLEFEVTDGWSGVFEYTDLKAVSIYDNGQKSVSLTARDWVDSWERLGGHDRITSGRVGFSGHSAAHYRDAGWLLARIIHEALG